MNTQFLFVIFLKCWFWCEIIARSTPISEVKFDTHTSNKNKAHARKLLSKEQRYLYLNYKEAYGLRFEPKKINKRQQISNESSTESTWNNQTEATVAVTTIGIGDIQTVSISPENGMSEMTTIASPSSSVVSITTQDTVIDDKVSSTSLQPPVSTDNKRQVLAFSSLLNRVNASNRPNVTTFQQPLRPSTLRDTLNLIRKRLKQWISFGTDPKASLINGQRFLNVFNVIKFDNSPCTSTQDGLTEMSGICYHDYQCNEMGGAAIDGCADGLGVCCIFKSTCGQTTNQLDIYFQNPGWPEASQDRLICTLTVEMQEDVAQIPLDFVTFELKPPTDGNCVDDTFYVAGQNLNNQIPTLCGVNSGQHMYIEVDNSLDRKLFVSVLTSSVATRAFNIRVTQVRSNCLQYYTETEGWFQTFNYDDTSQYVTNRIPSYFNNLNYVVCIKRQWNFCSTAYSNEADDVEYDFQLINIDSEGTSLVPEKQAGIEIFSCNDDFISVNSIRLCGEKLNDASRNDDLTMNAVITDTTNGLNFIPVRTNGGAVGRGFRINYVQLPCEDQPITVEPVIETTEEPAPSDEGDPVSKYKRTMNT